MSHDPETKLNLFILTGQADDELGAGDLHLVSKVSYLPTTATTKRRSLSPLICYVL
jgi:hypothetical protein